ncbi:MAG TPA: hypothetical protein DHM44_01725 [Flexistipes sinusarabici]|uniref:Putative zinc-finger domain-containing protein n=1 Tax=Flexistipes sinusarabici TaxID=2352 RepID=A0A3D5Q9P1_FLESI|nr:hypothetical protein [Flexistipes sinusarabici]
MKCQKYRKLISLYVDDELSSVHENELFEHIGTCPSCKTALKNESMLKSYIKDSYSGTYNVDFSCSIMAKIENKNNKKKSTFKAVQRSRVVAGAAVVIVFSSIVTLSALSRTDYFAKNDNSDNLEKFVYEHMDKSSPEQQRSFELTSVNFHK